MGINLHTLNISYLHGKKKKNRKDIPSPYLTTMEKNECVHLQFSTVLRGDRCSLLFLTVDNSGETVEDKLFPQENVSMRD